jgi:calcineurin-like phosphoesterase family protein
MHAPATSGDRFGRPRRSATEQLVGLAGAAPPQPFQPLPPPTGAPPFRLGLDTVIGADAAGAIETAGTLTFHAVGDTGGVTSPQDQQIVAQWMEQDLATLNPPPAFFYHLGDVVYFDGERSRYYDEFYDPYLHYTAPIFAIPGNHDGDLGIPPVGTSLEGFMVNFCAAEAVVTPDARDAPRPAMIQPNCYWTLVAPLVTIVGLYTNCPEHGVVEQDQADWFRGELTAADRQKALIVALHHPPYSADNHHGASAAMRTLLDDAFASSGRAPDLVLTGHVHDYQRFSVPNDNGTITYVVAGAGGYPNLHSIAHVDGAPPPVPWTDPGTGATLESYNQEHRHGFLRITVTANDVSGVYTTVPRMQESWSDPTNVKEIDTFTIQRM